MLFKMPYVNRGEELRQTFVQNPDEGYILGILMNLSDRELGLTTSSVRRNLSVAEQRYASAPRGGMVLGGHVRALDNRRLDFIILLRLCLSAARFRATGRF